MGGALWWLHGQPVEFIPEFNTLYLFLPAPSSFHMVSPVSTRNVSTVRRFAVSGWFETEDGLHEQRVKYYSPASKPLQMLLDHKKYGL